MRTLKYIVAILALVGFVGYVCYDIFFPNGFDYDEEAAKRKQHKAVLNIGALNNISSLPIWVAEEDSIFDSLRVDISVRDYTDQLDCDMAFANKKINIEITGPKRAEWLKKEKKTDFTELAKLPMPYAMMANHKARLSSIKQLKDKMLAATRLSLFHEEAYHCIDSVGLKRDSVYVVQINNHNVAMQMLQNNELDASFLTEPYITLAKIMGHNALYSNKAEALLIARTDADQKELKKFQQAYNEAIKRIRTNGVEHYTKLIADRCQCSPQFGKDLKVKF